MKNSIIIYFAAFTCFFFSACKNNQQADNQRTLFTAGSADSVHVDVKYAQGFNVSYHDNYRLVDIQDPQHENETVYHYALVNRGQRHEGIPKDYIVIEVPVQKVVCMTTLQLSNFIKLNAIDKVVGMTSTHYLFNQQMKDRIKNGQASQIGIEGNFDNEVVMALDPDIILVSPFKRGGYESIKDLNIPLVTFLGYKETTALGQAEWIKFTAMLLGIEQQANQQFAEIEKKYQDLITLASKADKKPIVLSGEMRSGNWYVVGGKSFLAQQFRDAGAEYFLKDNIETGGINMDFESVYSKGANADYWRMLVSHDGDYSYEAMKQSDARYADFKAFKEKKVVCCNLRQKPFYEKAPVEPEVVLADLIKAFHPELLPDHKPVYYELLK
ncbi:iron complex transport system substrate-binding protein [Dysgonomonas alginatilytica]|uniref:Iron complex transport system substrate-binding protein n=1 Tax=Dysgonomonas alginatilytica TaxID=1605892 RepID=A0A2V3PHY5_9BACT|nr:ABC transporter substrate-binding protein [Dysgonomonas alginatilytica]PXV58895.1 iron complex transport system substrate-binding protein [Dysgonomonas alginatilytica]